MFYRTAYLIIINSVMGCLAIVAVALRLWAGAVRKMRRGAEDILIIIGLVRHFRTRLGLRFLLTIARFWRLVCAFAISSEQRYFNLAMIDGLSTARI